jgi:putative ABC transport system permease protein
VQQASWRDVSLFDWRVLALVGTFLLILTVLVSLAPIVGLERFGIAAASRQVAARASLAQRFAAALQIAIAGALGGAALAFGWHLVSLTLLYPGYEHRDRFVVQYTSNSGGLTNERFRELMAATVVDLSRRREAIEAIPGVSAVAFGTPVPGFNAPNSRSIPDPSDATRQIQLRTSSVDSRYVDVLRLRLLHGRSFADSDSNVVMVNRAFARRFFGRDNVVGEALGIGTGNMPGLEIVGVLEDLSFEHPAAEVEPIVFQKLSSTATGIAIVESSLTAAGLQQELERLTLGGGLEVRVGTLRPLTQLRDTLIAPDRARSWLTIGAAVLVVVLAAVGFYGTQRYLVTAGRREYAIRASIGAGPKALGRLVIRRGLMLGLPGLVVGTLLAFVAVAWLRDAFVSRDVSAFAVTLVVAAGLVLLLAVASFGPARQAMRTQPAPLLRED